jgi:zinc transporter ZupT
MGVLLGLSAGFLLYIATSDIIPTIHEQVDKKNILDPRPFLLVVGVVVVGICVVVAKRFGA